MLLLVLLMLPGDASRRSPRKLDYAPAHVQCVQCVHQYMRSRNRATSRRARRRLGIRTHARLCIQRISGLSNHTFYATMRSGQILTAAIAHTRTYTHYCCGTKDPTRSLGSYYAGGFPGPTTTVITVRFTVRSIYSTHQVHVHVQVEPENAVALLTAAPRGGTACPSYTFTSSYYVYHNSPASGLHTVYTRTCV